MEESLGGEHGGGAKCAIKWHDQSQSVSHEEQTGLTEKIEANATLVVRQFSPLANFEFGTFCLG